MSQVDEIRKRRDGIETQLKDVACDMSKTCIVSFVMSADCILTIKQSS